MIREYLDETVGARMLPFHSAPDEATLLRKRHDIAARIAAIG